MYLLEFLALSLFWIVLFFCYKEHRDNLFMNVSKLLLSLLSHPVVVSLITPSKSFADGKHPIVSKHRKSISIRYYDKGHFYTIHLPLDRTIKNKRTVNVLKDGKILQTFLVQEGIPLFITKEHFYCDELEIIEE